MNRSNIRKAYVASFLKNLQFFGPVSVPYFLDWLRVDYLRMFLLQAWFLFWVFTLEIPTGVVADKFGRKYSVALGCILFAADMLFFGLSSSYYLLLVAEFLGAVGLTFISGADQALFYDSLIELNEQERARFFFSRCEAAGNFGLLVSFPIGSGIAALRSDPGLLAVPFSITAVSVGMASVVYFWMREPARSKPKEGFIQTGLLGLRTLLAHRRLRAYVLNAVTISSITFFAFWFYQPVVQRGGLGIAWFGWVGAGFNLFSTLLLTQIGAIEKIVSVRRLLLVSAVAPGVLFILLGYVHALAFAIPGLFLLVGCKMIRVPVLNAFINRHIESENRTTVISSVSLLERLVTFLLYPVVGLLADASLDYALWFLGGVCLIFAGATRLSARLIE